MRIILDINEDKKDFVLELLRNLPFVKFKQVSKIKSEQLNVISEGFEDLKKLKSGKIKGTPISELINEL